MGGKAVHFTIPIDDPERGIAFYKSAFGWDLRQWGPVDYWSIEGTTGEGIDGGINLRSDDEPSVIVYVEVGDLNEALSAVVDAGGRRASDRMPIPGTGWIARVIDTEGNVLGLFQSDKHASLAD